VGTGHYALWLIPSETAYARLAQLIKELAHELSAPLFDPHVTLLEGIRWETAKIVRQCEELAASSRPFEIHLGKENFERASKRSIFYRDMMERIFREEGLPTELVFLAQIESGFDPLALLSANARGLWQFMSPGR
jgi:hypothetical protein